MSLIDTQRIHDLKCANSRLSAELDVETGALCKKIRTLEADLKKQSEFGFIPLTEAEAQSGLNRVRGAEDLILQLSEEHEGRNTWLMNYGVGEEAYKIRRGYRRVHMGGGKPTKPMMKSAKQSVPIVAKQIVKEIGHQAVENDEAKALIVSMILAKFYRAVEAEVTAT